MFITRSAVEAILQRLSLTEIEAIRRHQQTMETLREVIEQNRTTHRALIDLLAKRADGGDGRSGNGS